MQAIHGIVLLPPKKDVVSMDRTNVKSFKRNIKGDLKSRKIKKFDKAKPCKRLARMVDDEYEVSDSSKYSNEHVDGKVYTSKNKEPKKSYTPLDYQKPRKTELNKMTEQRKRGRPKKNPNAPKQRYNYSSAIKARKQSQRRLTEAKKRAAKATKASRK